MPPDLVFCRVQPHGQIRTATYQGQPHLVVPVIALRPMVVNTRLAPAEAIAASVPHWQGVPIVVTHPQDATGSDISANASPVVAEQIVGRFWNCTYSQGRLRGEMWLNLQVAEQLGGEVLEAVQALQRGEAMDVSTGFFAEVEEREGTYQGRAYTGIFHDIRPDHLALLPNAVGACSWDDGCGAPRTHRQGASDRGRFLDRLEQALSGLFTLRGRQDPSGLQTQRSDVDIRTALYDLLAQEMGVTVTPIIIQFLDQDERAFVYRMGERVLMRRYTMGDEGAIALAPEVQSVQLDTRLIPVGETMAPQELPQSPSMMGFQAQEGSPVDKTQAITTILTNLHLESAESRATLEALDGAVLTTFATVTGAMTPPAAPQAPAPVTTVPEALARIGVAPSSPVYATLDAAVKTYEAQRTALITALVEAQCPLAREALAAAPLETLESYRTMMQIPGPGAPVVSYLGQGAASPTTGETLDAWMPPEITPAALAAHRQEVAHG